MIFSKVNIKPLLKHDACEDTSTLMILFTCCTGGTALKVYMVYFWLLKVTFYIFQNQRNGNKTIFSLY